MEFRKARTGDFDRITEFYKHVISDTEDMAENVLWIYGLHPADDIIMSYIDENAMYIMEEDGIICAAGAMTLSQEEDYHDVKWNLNLSDDEVSVIHILCSDPDRKRQGIAKRFMSELTRVAKSENKKAIRLDALYCNIHAQKLYESLGYIKCDEKHWYACNIGWTDFYLYEYELGR